MNGINDLQTNTGVSNVTEYTIDMVVQQLDRDNRVLKQYTLTSCFPQAISAIDLNMDTVNEVKPLRLHGVIRHSTLAYNLVLQTY